MSFEYEIIRSGRRSVSLQITKEARLLVRAPYEIEESEIEEFIEKKSRWIGKHLEEARRKLEERRANPIRRISDEEIRALADQAAKVLPGKVAYYAPIVGVTYGRIRIGKQKTFWGSCNAKGNLSFNCLLMLAPDEVQNYLVVHELCHRLEMGHSSRFWKEVERVVPDYKKSERWLKEHADEIMSMGF